MPRNPAGGGREPPSPPEPTGYCQPPKHSQFKPGQSGNPAGRPKGCRNLKTELLEELNELIVITENQEKKRVTKRRAIIKSVVAKAASGDVRILAMIFDKLFAVDANPDPASDVVTDPGDQAIIERLKLRLGGTPPHREKSDE